MTANNLPKSHRIDADALEPIRKSSRFQLTPKILGRLEQLAKARFDIRPLSRSDIDEWRRLSVDACQTLAQSVNASSQIENEHIRVEELDLVLAAVMQQDDNVVTIELSERARAVKSIVETYLWALTLDKKSFIDFDFVLEIHARMFVTTRPLIAGRLKHKNVAIRGSGYDVMTLAPEKVPVYLRAICARTNERLLRAQEFAEESMLLIVAEFILDFLAIHPFEDGNGRVARLLSTYLLERSGYHFARFYPLDSVILETRDAYYQALFLAQKDWFGESEDLTSWVEYYINSIYTQYLRAFQRVLDRQHNRF